MRTLTITQNSDWHAGLRRAGRAGAAGRYAGESLNFETPAQLFSHMTEKRWQLIQLAQGKGELAVRELARLAGRDVKRVHDDVVALAELGIFERTEGGGVCCPFERVSVDFMLQAA